MHIFVLTKTAKTMKTQNQKHGKVEKWIVNGHSFLICSKALDYCIENKWAITDESIIEHRNVIAHLWNVTSIK